MRDGRGRREKSGRTAVGQKSHLPGAQPYEESGLHASAASAVGQRGFQRIDKHRRHIASGLVVDFLETGRTGHIDLGDIVADHIDPDQQQATRRQHRTERLADLAITFGQWLGHPLAPHRQIAAYFAALRNPRQ